MAKTLDRVLFNKYWDVCRRRRLPGNIKDFKWFITDEFRNVKMSRIGEKTFLYAAGLGDKQIVELDCDGTAFYLAAMIPGSKMAEKALEKGWEEIPEDLYEMEVKDL